MDKMKDNSLIEPPFQIFIFCKLVENKGIALRLLKRYPEALNEFYKLCQMGPLSSQWPYPYYQMGITLEASDKDEEALDFYDDAFRILRKQPNSTDQMGTITTEYTPEGVAIIGLPSIDLDTILIQKGRVLGRLGKPKDALKCFDDALELNPTADAWKGKGMVLTDLIARQVNSNPELKSKHGKLNYDSNLREDILAKIGEAQACFEKVFEITNPNATSDAVDDTEIHRATEVLLKILHLLPDDKK
jgi:tetratricopeptide (TPR) repeat protein